MAGKKQLAPVRVIQADERPPEPSVSASQSRLQELRAMRRVLAAHIDNENTLARDLAPLIRQVREISREVEELEAVEAEVHADDDSAEDAAFRLEAI